MTTERQQRFEHVYDACSGPILAYALRRTASPDDAADVVAETFTVVWRRLDDVPMGVEARPWVYGVAKRVLANHHRGAHRRVRLEDRLQTTMAQPRQEEAQDFEPIAAAFGSLNERDRELLSLVAWDGLSHAEIATALGWSAATVRLRLHRARKRFRTQLDTLQHSPEAGHVSMRRATARPDLEEA